ncbi:MAG: hypothetical protein SNJ77_02535 [Cytophagales bacterium]
MKKILFTLFTFGIAWLNAQNYIGAVGKDDWTKGWTSYKPTSVEYPKISDTLKGVINKNINLSSSKTYLLKGTVYVTNGATLNIEPGTIIRADINSNACLVVCRGSKINAEGTPDKPIVFSTSAEVLSRKSGDWGGIVILGAAPVNIIGGETHFDEFFDPTKDLYGGSNPEDNSGTLKFVRIEFSGKKISANQELNGLSLAGVGSGTTVEKVMISYSNDDAFEFYGGTVNASHLISFRTTDDDFDFTMGYNGTVSHLLSLRHQFVSDFSGSKSFEIDTHTNPQKANPSAKQTHVKAKNCTFVVLGNDGTTMNKISAIHIGDNSSLEIENSVVSNFSNFVSLGGKTTENQHVTVKSCVLNNSTVIVNSSNNLEASATLTNKIKDNSWKNKITNMALNNLFLDASNAKHPDMRYVTEFLSLEK